MPALLQIVTVTLGLAVPLALVVHLVLERSHQRRLATPGLAAVDAPAPGVTLKAGIALAIALPLGLVSPLFSASQAGAYLAIYFVIWWVMLFATLPFGIRSQHETEVIVPGSEPGAPVLPDLAVKALWTTVISTIVFCALVAIHGLRLATLEDLATLFGVLR